MPSTAKRIGLFVGLVIVMVALLITVDGGISPAAAVDRWVGTAVIEGFPIAFTVLVNPGDGASWEWRYQGIQLGTGPLSATISGSRVNGTLVTTGGAIFEPGVCCRPCFFSGTIAGNSVTGSFDPVSCEGNGSFTLVKQ